MDEEGFRAQLRSRHLATEIIDRSVEAVHRFEEFLRRWRPAASADWATAGDLERFLERSEAVIRASDDLLAIARYARFARNDQVLVAVLERIDGAEVPDRMAEQLGRAVGETERDDVFGGLVAPPAGAAPEEKSAFMRALVARLSERVDPSVAGEVLVANLHYQAPADFDEPRARYLDAPDIDQFLEDEHRRYVEYLEQFREDGVLYYTQPVTDEVVAYVRATPTCGGGVRHGDEVRVTKVPYQADRYLRETDETRKRYLYCHCPWARESILHPEATVPALFCNCSAGFENQYWDAVLGRAVHVDVVSSVLEGALVCEFAVHLPPEVVPAG